MGNVKREERLLEQALRYLSILIEVYPIDIDERKIAFLDFIACYISKDDSLKTLLPAYSNQSLIYLNEKDVEISLKLLMSKNLIDYNIFYNKYTINANSKWFIESMDNNYYHKVQVYIKKAVAKYKFYSNEELIDIIKKENKDLS